MRIVLDLQACQSPSRLRGIGRYSMALAKAIVRRAPDHEIVIALNGALGDTIADIHSEFDGLLPNDRIVVWSQPADVGFLTTDSHWRIQAAERLRERFLESLRPDIVHVGSLFEGIGDDVSTSVGEIAQRLPTAVTLYDLIPLAQKEIHLQDPRMANWYTRKLMSLHRADRMLAISEYSRREAIELLGIAPERVVTISSAADPMFSPADPTARKAVMARYRLTRPYVLYNGTIEHHKNVAGLLTAFARLPPEVRKAHQLALVCSLHPADEVRLKTMARKAGLHDADYVVTGFVSDSDLVALYSFCRLFVFPSLREGFGLPPLEAMSCGAAVISSNTTSLPEVIGHDDALFDPNSPEDILRSLRKALGDEGLLGELRRHGLKRAKLFSWNDTADRTLDVFRSLYDERQDRPPSIQVAQIHRPRLAFVAPLPPDASALAQASAPLLGQLIRSYNVECVVDQDRVDLPVTVAGLTVRSAEWMLRNGARFDRIVYNVGDHTACHTWMLDLLRRWPGAVLLQDSHIGRSLAELSEPGRQPSAWLRELYRSHGWTAVSGYWKSSDKAGFMSRYLCTESIVHAAAGVIAPGAEPCAEIERLSGLSRFAALDRLADDLIGIDTVDQPTAADWEAVLRCAAENQPAGDGARKLMIDVSELVQRDAGTGIQRVTNNIMMKCLESPPAGFRVEPVYDDGSGTLRYAHRLAAKLIGLEDLNLGDDRVDLRAGDILLGVDLIAHQIEGRNALNRYLRQRGIRSYYVVYDLLPLNRPEWFPPFPQFRTWLQRIGSFADGLVCISRAVADQLIERLPELGIDRKDGLKVGHFHLGADIGAEGGVPSPEVQRILTSRNPVFLVVGTIEPRKGHAQALAAFERLWARGVEAELVIVGKQGWMVEKVADRMRGHAQANKRLHWLAHATDADLNALYNGCSALLGVSLDEGFGLPLIEAAKHALPILARDIPVFREIAGEHAVWFSGTTAEDLAGAVEAWIDRWTRGNVPTTANMPWLTWEQSAEQLLNAVLHDAWDAEWSPCHAAHGACPTSRALETKVTEEVT
jgi:glycosyltransferase involved in cell wall biosynthesis